MILETVVCKVSSSSSPAHERTIFRTEGQIRGDAVDTSCA